MNLKQSNSYKLAIAVCLYLVTVSGGIAQEPPDDIVTTKHQVTVDGRLLKYTARAGHLPILDNQTGEVHGNMFFISYTLDSANSGATRPLTFLWNGGPGSSSSLVHLLGFGPRRLQPDGSAVDNPGTWLEQTDLVFIDPIGTGYSRPTKVEYGPEFYQNIGDAESVAEFIRVYRNRFEFWDAPIFLAGESFGVTRAAGVADVLQRRSIPLSGVILMGLTLPLGQLNNEQRAALALPSFTAAAFANKKLEPSLQSDFQATLQQAETFALSTYLPALTQRDSLTEAEKGTILSQLARFSGLNPKNIDAKSLTISMEAFSKQLLAERNQVVGRYDSRLVGPLTNEQIYDPTKDPSLKNIINDIGVLRYFRNELKYKSDLKYQGPFGGGYPPPTAFRGDWMSVKWKFPAAPTQSPTGTPAAPAPPEQPLRRAMIANPKLRVLVTCGYYDLVCNYSVNIYLATHLETGIPRNVTARGYGGGHALYTDQTAQLAFKHDVMKFMQDAVSTGSAASQPNKE